MAWTDFTVTTAQVSAYDPNMNLTADKLLAFIAQGQSDVEDRLKILIYTKFRDAGKSLPDDLPSPVLDAMLSDSYTSIRKLVIFKTLDKVYAKSDAELSAHWMTEYDKVDWDDINIYIDLDADATLDTEEFISIQDSLDNRQR